MSLIGCLSNPEIFNQTIPTSHDSQQELKISPTAITPSPAPIESPTQTTVMNPEPTLTKKPVLAYQALPVLQGMNIGNALDAPTPGEWGVEIRQDHFNAIRSAGFNAVRIPVRFSAHTGSAPDFLINNEFFQMVDKAITWGLKQHDIVILDLHHFEEIKQNPQHELDRFYAIWGQIAERYQNAPPELYFELLNEPSMNLDSDTWNQMINTSVGIIRKSNPNRKIIVGGINYYHVKSLDLLTLPSDNNLIATFHYYEPFHFTHQGASWVEGAHHWRGSTWQGTQSEKDEIRAALDFAVDWSNMNQIPVIMGEFGVIKEADITHREKWTSFMVQEAAKRGINWFYWELCSGFGVYDCENGVWDEILLNALLAQ